MTAAGSPPVALDELRRMSALLAHRGPDGYGLFRDARVGLAHARLSLVDLEGSFQPLHNEDRSLWLAFNGEIFNYRELRHDLIEQGHRFATRGDGEVILQCYQRHGARAWAMLNGQFAFALWDRRLGKLWLVRDRLGILPLQYAQTPEGLVFASEAKAIFAGGRVRPKLDPQGIGEIFSYWSAAAPRTPFADLRAVRPGHALCVGADLSLRESAYWTPSFGAPLVADEDEAIEALGELLTRSVNLRLHADVPVGCYISGGLDSSVIGSFAQELAEQPLETFGIRFADPRFDETAEQRAVVGHLGTRHHEILCDDAAIREALDEVIWHCETPLLRTAPVPLYLLARKVRETGIKTVMTGEGADELLAGYSIFKEDAIRRFWARQPESAWRPRLLDRIHHYVGDEDMRSPLWRNFFARGLENTGDALYSHRIRWQNTAWTWRLLAPEIRDQLQFETLAGDITRQLPPDWGAMDALTRAQWLEIQTFMSPYLLACQGDRVAMASGIEARYPFLDPAVVDFCLSLPRPLKQRGLRDKRVLRGLAARRLPPAIHARRKQPFRAPIGAALFGPEADGCFDDLIGPAALAQVEGIDPVASGRLLARVRALGGRAAGEREEMGLVGILTLAMWQRAFGAGFRERCTRAMAKLDTLAPHVLEDELEEIDAQA